MKVSKPLSLELPSLGISLSDRIRNAQKAGVVFSVHASNFMNTDSITISKTGERKLLWDELTLNLTSEGIVQQTSQPPKDPSLALIEDFFALAMDKRLSLPNGDVLICPGARFRAPHYGLATPFMITRGENPPEIHLADESVRFLAGTKVLLAHN